MRKAVFIQVQAVARGMGAMFERSIGSSLGVKGEWVL